MLSALSSPSFNSASIDNGGAARDSSSQKTSGADAETIRQLAETDRKVRAHEAAHMAAAGGLAVGGASFGYTRGPDGKQYAVSGEVSISVRKGEDAAATLRIAEQIRRAALAPADPSGQDRSVAAQADAMASQARLDMRQEQASSYDSSTAQARGQQIDTEA